jgi:hypothetical protein
MSLCPKRLRRWHQSVQAGGYLSAGFSVGKNHKHGEREDRETGHGWGFKAVRLVLHDCLLSEPAIMFQTMKP